MESPPQNTPLSMTLQRKPKFQNSACLDQSFRVAFQIQHLESILSLRIKATPIFRSPPKSTSLFRPHRALNSKNEADFHQILSAVVQNPKPKYGFVQFSALRCRSFTVYSSESPTPSQCTAENSRVSQFQSFTRPNRPLRSRHCREQHSHTRSMWPTV